MISKENIIRIENLEENMSVYVPYDRYGWNFFRYPIMKLEVIKRITPKKTKVYTDQCEHDKYQAFYEVNEETSLIKKISEMAEVFQSLTFRLRNIDINKLSDEQILKLGNLSLEIFEITKEVRK